MSRVEGLVSVLRVHRRHQQPSALAHEPVDRLVDAVRRASLWSQVIVAYDAADVPLSYAISERPELNPGQRGEEPRVELLPVQPWNFTLPLNASVIYAHMLGASKIVFISLEITISTDELSQILSLWSKETLVIGKTLNPHKFKGNGKYMHGQATTTEHYVELTGLTSPWNTFAIWDLVKLAKTGFLAVSDTNVEPGQSAIEEVPTIALHQRLFPNDSGAVLVRLPDSNAVGWDTNWNDPQRAVWQKSKLASKDLSAASHLQLLGLGSNQSVSRSGVRHLDLS